MSLPKVGHLVSLFFQWWLTSDQILFRHFFNHESMIFSLGVALGVNLWGVIVLYVPIEYLVPEATFKRLRSYLQNRFPMIQRHIQRLDELSENIEESPLGLLKSREARGKAVSRIIETYEYDYLFVFCLSCLPIPFLGTAMTLAALFAIEALDIKFGLWVVFLGKIVKVFALASIAYFAYFM